MYTLLNRLGWNGFITREMPSLVLSWILAEVFYKFGSFTLETGAFLGTWYLIGFVLHRFFSK